MQYPGVLDDINRSSEPDKGDLLRESAYTPAKKRWCVLFFKENVLMKGEVISETIVAALGEIVLNYGVSQTSIRSVVEIN